MIELVAAFIAGIMYALVGVNVARKVEAPINLVMLERGLSPAWGVYISFMTTLLWPLLVSLIVLATGYATLKSIRA